jgi:hypothetical protein
MLPLQSTQTHTTWQWILKSIKTNHKLGYMVSISILCLSSNICREFSALIYATKMINRSIANWPKETHNIDLKAMFLFEYTLRQSLYLPDQNRKRRMNEQISSPVVTSRIRFVQTDSCWVFECLLKESNLRDREVGTSNSFSRGINDRIRFMRIFLDVTLLKWKKKFSWE